MSGPRAEPDRLEGFLQRWSRRKRAATRPEARTPAPPTVEPVHDESIPDRALAEDLAAQHRDQDAAAAAEPFDPVSLPPVEELGADSDYKPFLNERVPEELRRLALRRAWASDPAIANFRGFAEYDWDCNAPGYGRLLAGDDVERLARAVFGNQPDEPRPETDEGTVVATAAPSGPIGHEPDVALPELAVSEVPARAAPPEPVEPMTVAQREPT